MVLASAHARRRVIPVVLTALVMLFGPALAQYSPAQEPATEDQAKMDRGQELLQDQARLRAKYQEFEDSLIQLANAMQATDPARAELLRKAFAQAKERDDARYELDLEIWKVESQIRLLVARLTMSPGDVEMQEKLRSLLMERVDLRIRRQRMDRDRLAARVQRLDENIASLESEREALVDQSYAKLIESVSTFGIQPQRRSPAAAAASKTDPATNKPENKRPN